MRSDTNVVVPTKIHTMCPRTNQEINALQSSTFQGRALLMENHLNRIFSLDQKPVAAASNSSFVGRCGIFGRCGRWKYECPSGLWFAASGGVLSAFVCAADDLLAASALSPSGFVLFSLFAVFGGIIIVFSLAHALSCNFGFCWCICLFHRFPAKSEVCLYPVPLAVKACLPNAPARVFAPPETTWFPSAALEEILRLSACCAVASCDAFGLE